MFGDEFYLTKQQCEVMGLKEEYEYEVEQEKENMLDWCKDMLGKDVKYIKQLWNRNKSYILYIEMVEKIMKHFKNLTL